MSNLVHIDDSDSFCTHMNVLDDGGYYEDIQPTLRTSTSNSKYGILNENFGWIKDIHVDIISGELQIGFTKNRKHALAIEGCVLKGRILTWGSCILLQ